MDGVHPLVSVTYLPLHWNHPRDTIILLCYHPNLLLITCYFFSSNLLLIFLSLSPHGALLPPPPLSNVQNCILESLLHPLTIFIHIGMSIPFTPPSQSRPRIYSLASQSLSFILLSSFCMVSVLASNRLWRMVDLLSSTPVPWWPPIPPLWTMVYLSYCSTQYWTLLLYREEYIYTTPTIPFYLLLHLWVSYLVGDSMRWWRKLIPQGFLGFTFLHSGGISPSWPWGRILLQHWCSGIKYFIETETMDHLYLEIRLYLGSGVSFRLRH